MQPIMRSPAMDAFIRRVVAAEQPRELVAVDRAIVGSWLATETGFVELLQAGGGSTALEGPVRTLLEGAECVVIITDRDGLSSMEGLDVSVHHAQALAPESILVRVCVRTPTGPQRNNNVIA